MPEQQSLPQPQNNSNLPLNAVDPCAELSAINQQLQQQLVEQSRLLEQAQHRVMELEDQNYFINSLIQHLPTPIFVKEAKELRFVSWNKASEELFGLKEEQVLGKNDYDFFPQQEADFFTGKDRLVLASNQILDIPEEPIHTANQGTHFLHIKKVPIFGPDSQPKFLLGISEDITARKQNEETLRQFNQVVESSPAVLFRWVNNPEVGWPVNLVSQNVTRFGYTAEEFLAGTISFVDIMHPADVERIGREIEAYIASGMNQFRLSYRIKTKDGQIRWVDDYTTVERDEQGQITHTQQELLLDVTERKLVEEKLHTLSRAVEQNSSTIVITDTRGYIEYANPKFTETTGYSLEEVLGQHTRLLKSGHTSAEEYQQLWEVINQGHEWRGEFHNKRKNGEFYWESATISPIKNTDGVITHYLAVKEDITARKQTEEALRLSETRNRALLNAFPDLVIHLQRDGTYLDVKPTKDVSAAGLPSELLGKKVSEVLPPEMAEWRMRYIEQVLQTGQPHSLEQQLFRDNQLHDEELRIVPSGADEVLIIVRDITERKQVERQLRQNQSLLQAIIDNTVASIYVLDAQGRFLLINNTFATLFNLDKKAVIGKTDYDIFHQDIAEAYQGGDLEILRTGIPVQLEEFVPHADGLHTYVTLKFPLFDESGQPFALCGMSTDITEQKRTEGNLVKRVTELETVAEVGTAVSTILEIDTLLQLVVDLTKSRFNLYHAHIYLLNPAGNTLTLAAATGEVGQKMLAQHWQIPLSQEQSLVARTARTRQGIIANNVCSRSDFLANLLLPETQAEMAIPIIAGSNVLGVLDVQSDKLDYFTNEDIRVQSVLADQVAAAIQNTRLFQEIQLALNETEALNRIARTLGQLTDSRALTETALLEYLYILDLPQGGVLFFDEYRTAGTVVALVQHNQLAEPGLSIPVMNNPSYEELFITKAPVIINDALHDTLLEPARGLIQKLDIKSLLLVPIIVRGEVIGALGADSTETIHEFTAREVALGQSVADQLGVAVENRRLLEEAQARARREQLLREVTTRVRSAIDAETIMRTAVQEVGRTLGRPAFIYLGHDQQLGQEEANQPVREGN